MSVDTSPALVLEAPTKRIARDIDLPFLCALWVLFAHGVTVLSPIYLSYVAYTRADVLATRVAAPWLLHLAAALLVAASAFEVAQNAADRWYVTPETGSALGTGFSDMLFYGLLTCGMAAFAMGIHDAPWVLALEALAIVVFFPAYLLKGLPHPASGISTITTCVAMYARLGDAGGFLFIVFGTVMLLFFFQMLLKTSNQWLHGATTISSAIGFYAMTRSLDLTLAGQPTSVTTVLIWLGITVAFCGLVYPFVSKLEPTPRKAS